MSVWRGIARCARGRESALCAFFFQNARPRRFNLLHSLASPLFPTPAYPGAERFHLHYGDLIDFGSLCSLLK